jgi:hypothetical protein
LLLLLLHASLTGFPLQSCDWHDRLTCLNPLSVILSFSPIKGIYWAERSIDFAFSTGIECCTVIPVRAGNGAMDLLLEKGDFNPPDIHSLETVLETVSGSMRDVYLPMFGI